MAVFKKYIFMVELVFFLDLQLFLERIKAHDFHSKMLLVFLPVTSLHMQLVFFIALFHIHPISFEPLINCSNLRIITSYLINPPFF